jgi:hypothetical protein
VIQAGGRLSLGRQGGVGGRVLRVEHLHGAKAIEAALAGLEDDAEAASADFRDQFVIAELAGQRLIGRVGITGSHRA